MSSRTITLRTRQRLITTTLFAACLTLFTGGLTVAPQGASPAEAALPGKGVPCKVAHDGPYISGPAQISATFITDCREHGELIKDVGLSMQIYRLEWDRRLQHAVLKPVGRGKTNREDNDIAAVTEKTFCVKDAYYTIFFNTDATPTPTAQHRLGFRNPAFKGRNVTRPVFLKCETETEEFDRGEGTAGMRGPWGAPYKGASRPRDNRVKLCNYGPALLPCPQPPILA